MPSPPGTLILAANSLGNPDDIPPRALEWIRKADLLIFEEDRPARQVLKKAQIFKNYLKYNEHGQKDVLLAVEKTLSEGGSVLYMSDQGTSGVDDPGPDLVAIAYKIQASLHIIPGPSSITGAISASPLPLKKFFYLGFLPRDPQERREELKKSLSFKVPLVILDTPYRLAALIELLEDMRSSFRHYLLAKEIGNQEQHYSFATSDSIGKVLAHCDKKQNFVLILYP